MENIYFDAIKAYGKEAQIEMMVEECSELITDICHYKRGRIKTKKLIEELCDVSIMLNQMKIIFDYDNTFDKIYSEKLNRLKERLNNAGDI